MITGRRRKPWVVAWDNGHANGVFPYEFRTKRGAEEWARGWKRDMVDVEHTPWGRAEARRCYTWEVTR